ncbi:MAG: DUF1492 domain-containing protein [Peptococcaceae bacterium]|nr:DUF1492 domain-containing protein [Peptococcaceae bacterium]
MTKAEFRQYRYISREIEQLESQMMQLRTQAESPQPTRWRYTRGGGHVKDSMAEIVIKLVDMEREHARKWDELIEKQREIEAAIADLRDPEHRRLMRYRYIEQLTWELICVRLSVSWPTVHRIHNAALIAAGKDDTL